MKPFFVYMLECSDRGLYVGHTDELETRLAQHEAGVFPGYTSTRRPVRLVWHEEMASREEALAAELQIKGWTRAKKLALIEGDWERIRELAAPRTGPDRRRARNPSARPEPVEGRAQHDTDRSSFDRLRTNGVEKQQTGPGGASDKPRTNGVEKQQTGPGGTSARPEPVEGRARESTDRSQHHSKIQDA